MDKAKSLSLSGLILGSFLLTRNVGSSFAFDKPVHSSITVLAFSAIVLLAASRLLPREGVRTNNGHQYDAVPLSEVGQPHASREPSPAPEDVRYPSSLRKLRICFFLLICTTCARVGMLRYTTVNIQCTGLSWEPLIPLALATWDYWTTNRHKRREFHDGHSGGKSDEAIDSVILRSPYRLIYAAALLSIGSLIGLFTASGARSTFICASTLSNHWLVPFTQRLGTILDVAALYFVAILLEDRGSGGGRSLSLRVRSVGWALLISAATVLIYGLLYFAFATTPIQRKRILDIPPFYIWSLMKFTIFASFTLTSALIAGSSVGWTNVAFITVFSSVCALTTTQAWNGAQAYPPVHSGLGLFGFCLMILGFVGYLYVDTTSHASSRWTKPCFSGKMPVWTWVLFSTLLIFRMSLWAGSTSIVNYHPIDLLLYDAQVSHQDYFNQATTSKTLEEAAEAYRSRYGRHPPPGFEHWYKYATDRKSVIIDDFDTIARDLMPFWALPPEQIRERTWQMMSNPWHDASGLSIRNGKVEASPSKFTMPTHAWMLDGLVRMISTFAKWLPDMDLAFNVNDECRVAVPYEAMEDLRRAAEPRSRLDRPVDNAFSANRANGWTPLPEEPNTEKVMREMSWQRIFNEFGNAACSPDATARTQRHMNVGELCTSCVAPQSMGGFLANWTLANNVCHQPDIAHLHGMYLAPAAFKASHELYPIFSQSKVSGFNDILYPSAWNYIDKAQYDPKDDFTDPLFAEKNSTLFWRGATSEGFSSGGGQWKGMTRQRFIHLANGLNGTDNTRHGILTPYTTAAGEEKLTYQNVLVSDLTASLPTDVHVVKTIARCGGKDCVDQAHELAPLVEATDFQAHWDYKYLLDLDGAGFSGRFLPFMHSRSLPFKAAIFREWWDDRLTAWQHFVPLDIRGHGFWATLAYFVGVDGVLGGKKVVMEPHEKEAERIAEQGREWAGKVLRKEDMEIYFFRLLLEWGRLTDDQRENIGYAVDVG